MLAVVALLSFQIHAQEGSNIKNSKNGKISAVLTSKDWRVTASYKRTYDSKKNSIVQYPVTWIYGYAVTFSKEEDKKNNYGLKCSLWGNYVLDEEKRTVSFYSGKYEYQVTKAEGDTIEMFTINDKNKPMDTNYIRLRGKNGIGPLDEFNVKDFDGERNQVKLSDIITKQNGAPVIVYTWAHKWCYPCEKIMTKLNEAYYKKLNKKYGLKVITINLDLPEFIDETIELEKKLNWPFLNFMDPDHNIIKATRYHNAPMCFIIYKGKMLELKGGFYTGRGADTNAMTLEDKIKKVMKSK